MTWAEGIGRDGDYGRAESSRGDTPGATWNCARDANTINLRQDCSGIAAWEMDKPNRHPWAATPSASALIANGQTGSIEWNVTADVQAFLSGASVNHGWILKKTVESLPGRIDFASRESGHGPRCSSDWHHSDLSVSVALA